jgi:predicted dinucleotide-binding enzyme
MTMSIGIIGAGNIGLAVAKTLSRAGIAATIANSQGPDSLKESVGALGPTIKAGTREQADSADIAWFNAVASADSANAIKVLELAEAPTLTGRTRVRGCASRRQVPARP